jgi:hypothetical protein
MSSRRCASLVPRGMVRSENRLEGPRRTHDLLLVDLYQEAHDALSEPLRATATAYARRKCEAYDCL